MMRTFPACLGCGALLSRYDAKRCQSCNQRWRFEQRLATKPAVVKPSCPDCGRELYDKRSTRCNRCTIRLRIRLQKELGTTVSTVTVCPLDGKRVDHHARCRACTALCGSAHAQRMGSEGFCDACWRHFDRVALGRVDWREAS